MIKLITIYFRHFLPALPIMSCYKRMTFPTVRMQTRSVIDRWLGRYLASAEYRQLNYASTTRGKSNRLFQFRMSSLYRTVALAPALIAPCSGGSGVHHSAKYRTQFPLLKAENAGLLYSSGSKQGREPVGGLHHITPWSFCSLWKFPRGFRVLVYRAGESPDSVRNSKVPINKKG